MDGWERAILYDLPQRPALVVVKNAGDARRLAVQETVGTLGVEAKNPIAHDLRSNAANPRPSASRRRKPPQAPKDVGSDRDRPIPSPGCAVEPRQSQSEVEPE